jgi:hypothetical protein
MATFLRKTLSELIGQIISVCTYSIRNQFPPEFPPFDQSWDNLYLSLAFLKDKLGEKRYAQLVEMAAQAKEHFEAGHAPGGDDWEITLGARLTQDMEQVVKGRAPFAYPRGLYRWPRTPGEYGTEQSIQ